MPKVHPAAAVRAEDAVLTRLRRSGPLTRSEIGCSRYLILKMIEAKAIKRDGERKNLSDARKAVTYSLTAKGRKRAEKLA